MSPTWLHRLFPIPRPRRLREAVRPRVQHLEDRCTPATLYVDDTFAITNDLAPPGLSPGDTVTWDPGQADEVIGLTFGIDAFSTIHDASLVAGANDTIKVAAGSYLETAATVVAPNTTLNIIGAGDASTLVLAGFDSGGAFSGDSRAWILASSDSTLNVSGLTLDGNGHLIGDGIRYTFGSLGGAVDQVTIKNITLAASDYDGYGLNIKSGTVDVTNSKFFNLGRIGAQYTNAGTSGDFLNNVYTGKNTGDQLDYAVEVGDGADVLISGNVISQNVGTSLVDGSQSAGILVDSFFAPNSNATIIGNRIVGNIAGIFVGVTDGDGDTSTVFAQYNSIYGNAEGIHSTSPTVDAGNCWWGDITGPHNATNNPGGLGNSVTDNVTFAGFSTAPKQVVAATSVSDYLAKTNDLSATGADSGGGPHVKVFNNDGTLRFSFYAYNAGFTGGVRVATGDVNGDGVQDIITGAGPGGGPHVRVFDGVTRAELFSFMAYNPLFTGGVYVAAGDVNGDGFADIITGAGATGGPHVRVFDGVTGNQLLGFMAYDVNFTGGVTVSAADFNSDGNADIVTGAGPGGGPHVKVFDANGLGLLRSFMALDSSFTGGVTVSAGDVTGDLIPDVTVGAGVGGATRVRVFDDGNTVAQNLIAYDPTLGSPVRVSSVKVNGNDSGDLLLSTGSGSVPTVKVLDGRTLTQLSSFSAYDPAFFGGVFVG